MQTKLINHGKVSRFHLAVLIAAWIPWYSTMVEAAAPTPVIPRLQIQVSERAEVQLSWPATATEFTLEETADLSPVWLSQGMLTAPKLSGDSYRVTLPAYGAKRFFRLRYRPSALSSPDPALSARAKTNSDYCVGKGCSSNLGARHVFEG